MTTLVPATPTFRPVVSEGGQVGQFRVEIESAGAPLSYFLYTLQARGAGDANVTATATDIGTGFTLTLTHPTRGTAQLTFVKGATSTGGTIAVGGTPVALTTSVQAITVSDQGVTWGGAAPSAPPAAPTGLRIP